MGYFTKHYILATQVQAELGRPSLLLPDKGKVSIYIECSSTAEPAFEVFILLLFSFSLFDEVVHILWFSSCYSSLSTMNIDSKTNM